MIDIFSIFVGIIIGILFSFVHSLSETGNMLHILRRATHRCSKCNYPLTRDDNIRYCTCCGQEINW